MLLKPLAGTWFEFYHHNEPEGKYWNPICRHFSDAQWEEKVDEIASLGMKYIVLMCSSLVYEDRCETYFKNDIYPFAPMASKDPMGALMRAAERNGIKVFISAGFYGVWNHTVENMTSPEVTKRAFRAMEQLVSLYGNSPAFGGWYLPDETCIAPYFSDDFMKYVNEYAAFGRSLKKDAQILIAPYGTNMVIPDDRYVSQLEKLDVDIVAYQDEIGVRKSTVDQTAAYYEGLRRAHDKAGRSALWADMECFEFEEEVYKSALVPALMSRIEKQIANISPFADQILIYQYQGIFNKPGTTAFCGHPDSIELYQEYQKFLKRIKA